METVDHIAWVMGLGTAGVARFYRFQFLLMHFNTRFTNI